MYEIQVGFLTLIFWKLIITIKFAIPVAVQNNCCTLQVWLRVLEHRLYVYNQTSQTVLY